MKITTGKKYEGASQFSRLEDGIYVFQIVDVKQTKGKVEMQLITADKKYCFKSFWLIDKNGKPSDRGMSELADFVTTALQIEDDEIEVDIEDVLGHYIQAEVKNSSYTNEEGLTKSVQYVNRPARAECFPNGKPSLYEEIVNKRKSKTNRASASVEEPASDKQEDTVDLLKEWGL